MGVSYKHIINGPECSIEIIAYKEPSFVHKVAYENIVSEFFQTYEQAQRFR